MIENLSEKDKRAYAFVRTKILTQGESPTLREINEVTGGKSPRSASLVIERLIDAGLLEKNGRDLILTNTQSSNSINTVDIPLVGSVACGMPLLAEENIQTYIPVSNALAKGRFTYFLLRAAGDSMNKAGIKSGDLLLVRQQPSAETGEKIVALINDEATVKVFEKANGVVVLRPKSDNPAHKPIVLTTDCLIQGVVIAALPSDLE